MQTGQIDWRSCFGGVLLGTAVGDALGLPAENMSPRRIAGRWKGTWRMRLLPGIGMISDDTEHTLLVSQALLVEQTNASRFQRIMGSKLRWWFAALPAGVGLATAKACIRLWLGFPPSRSGVPSGGSGPAMRSGIIGAFFANDAARRREFVLASSRLTHRGWQAETAALAVAEVTALLCRKRDGWDHRSLIALLHELSNESEWHKHLDLAADALRTGMAVPEFAREMGLSNGVTGYALHVFAVALYALLLQRQDFRAGMCAVLNSGGDTDTAGAIFGAMCGAAIGAEGIPRDWVQGIKECPRTIGFMERIASRLAEQKASHTALGAVPCFWPAILPRNLLFLAVVLAHGIRRALPPY